MGLPGSKQCQCTAKCKLKAAEGHPFASQHDKRPERAEERARYYKGLHAQGALWHAKQVRKAAAPIDLGTPEAISAFLGSAAKAALEARDGGLAKGAAYVAQQALRALDVTGLEAENKQLREALAAARPELRAKLGVR